MAKAPHLHAVPSGRPASIPETAAITDFYAYLPSHKYLYVPTRQLWPGASINSVLDKIGRTSPGAWLDLNRPIHQISWSPGLSQIVRDQLVAEGGWFAKEGASCFNLYRSPVETAGDPDNAQIWLDHVAKLYPDDWPRIVRLFAHRVQRPEEKINHALVLGGAPGIGKDTLIEPLKHAIGPWNFQEVAPKDLLARFNPFLKAVVLRVSEARDMGEINRYSLYDHMKVMAAAPPDVLRIDEKHLAEYYIPNIVFILITTNYRTEGLYLPADDRRHDVVFSELRQEDFDDAYFHRIWRYFENGGLNDVATYLRGVDLAEFDAKAPPPKTAAFWAIVNAQRGPEEGELADVLDALGRPTAVTIERLTIHAPDSLRAWMTELKNRRVVAHRLAGCGYERFDNDDAKDGLWKINGRRQAVYGRIDMPFLDRLHAARSL
jgi:hypothetical protein